LKRKHVALLFVWDEYFAETPSGYSYPRFWELYRAFESKLSPTMRQTHGAGERLFVDYAGDGVPVVVDRLTPALPECPSLHSKRLRFIVWSSGKARSYSKTDKLPGQGHLRQGTRRGPMTACLLIVSPCGPNGPSQYN